MGGGSAEKLIKIFNKIDVPAQLFVIFTPGGIDFVGGYAYYQFLKSSFDQNGEPLKGRPLGKI